MRRKYMKPLYLSGMIDLCLLAAPAHAQDDASRQLISQGNYWHDQGRDDLASDTWKKLLRIDPRQPDALLGLGQIAIAQGRQGKARTYLDQLQASHPNAAQTQALRRAFSGQPSSNAGHLASARRAASAGRYAEAVKEYQQTFEGGQPRQELALEYYQSLAGTPDGWAQARAGIQRLHEASPSNGSLALAYAQLLTYREPSRREGIAQLGSLAKRADVGAAARQSLRQALLWLTPGTADLPLYQAYLADNPNDAQVQAKVAQARTQQAKGNTDVTGAALGQAFKSLDAGDLATAEQRFTQVLRAAPKDADALGGLGTIRLRQQRFTEAQELLRQAVASSGKWRSAYDAARYWTLLQQANAARGQGNPERAAGLARQALEIDPRQPSALVVLGDLQSTTNPQEAEANYRRALAVEPNNAGALQGLVGMYSRQGRMQEASDLFSRLSPAEREKAGGEAMLRSNVQRALARQSLEAGDTGTAQAQLEQAMVERPADPWVRLDLARLYQQIGRPDQARNVMDGLLAVHGDDPDALYANAVLAQERNDWAGVYASLEKIPQAKRSAEVSAQRNNAWVELQARQAVLLKDQGRLAEAQTLLSRTESALSDQLDQPALLAAVAGAYAEIGNATRALTLGQRLVAGPSPGVDERLQYAGILLRAHQDAELSAVLRQVQGLTLSPEQLRRYQSLRSSYVLRQVDALRGLGNLEGAYAILAPILAQQPSDRDALNALARMYAAAGDLRQTGAIYQQVLQSNPDDLDTLVAAANNAAAAKDLDSADGYLERALRLAPESPDTLAAAGRVYRAEGKSRKAEKYFKAALAAQQRQAGQLDNGFPTASGAAPFATADRSFNPFAGMTGPMRNNAAVLSDTAAAALPAAYPGSPAAPAMQAPAAAPVVAYAAAPATPSAATADDLPAPVAATTASAGWPVPGQRGVPVSAPAAATAYAAAPTNLASVQVVAKRPLPPVSSGNPVLDELRQLQSGNSGELDASASYRSRDGEAGLGKLDEIQTVLKGKFPLGEGKLEIDVTPTVVDAGQVSTDYATASRFGAGPSAALEDALASDTSIVDDYATGSLYQLLMTEGDTTASETLFYKYAVSTGLYSELYTTYGSDSATKAAVYEQPLFAYLLSIDAASTTISEIATAILSNSSLYEDLSDADLASLKALAASTAAASMTATELKAALYALQAAGSSSRRLGQDATGVGLSVKYANGGFRGDIGSTPLGFPEQRVVGGIGYKGGIGDNFNYDGQLYRRAVTDSVLSYAGAKDVRGDLQWGGVTSNGARVAGTVDNGLLGGYVNLAAARLIGHNVQNNSFAQADVGVYLHALETDNQSLTAGLNVTTMRYARNLSGYTYGQGGYFSPQQYFDVGFPVHWSGRSANQKVNWKVDASVGVQHSRTDDSNYFPTSAASQQAAYDAASIASLLGVSSSYTEPVYAGESKTGVSYNLSGTAEWQLAPQVFLGGKLSMNNARDYQQFNANVYLRFVLDRLGAALGKEPKVVMTSPYVSSD